jgi:hypothetical protein
MLEDYLCELLDRANVGTPRAKARQLWIVMEGAILMVLISGDQSYISSARHVARMMVAR